MVQNANDAHYESIAKKLQHQDQESTITDESNNQDDEHGRIHGEEPVKKMV